MSKIKAKIKNISTLKSLNIVTFEFYEMTLTMMSLELKDNIKIGKNVLLSANASHIAIAKNIEGLNEILSYSNQIKCKIVEIEVGELLCSLKLQVGDSILQSLITSKSAKKLNLELHNEVIALIKASELSISEVI